jgi:elongation factor G
MGNIFNAGIFGNNKSGKTVLGEAVLFKTGMTNRMGTITDGTTVFDYEAEEKSRMMSVNLSTGHINKSGKTLYIVDTPGYMDFLGEQISGVEAVDFGILTISADMGIESGTEKSWGLLKNKQKPVLLFINKMDLPEVKFEEVWKNIESFFGKNLVLITYPDIKNGKLNGVNELLEGKENTDENVKSYVQKSMDTIAELDDSLMEKYLEGEQLTAEEIAKYIKKGLLKGEIIPVLCGSALNQVGVEELVNFIFKYMPSTEELVPLKGKNK